MGVGALVMEKDIIGWIVAGGGAILLFLIGAVWQLASAKIASVAAEADANRDALNAFKIKVAESYPTTESLRQMLQPIMDELQKIDRKLDQKADK